MKDEMPSYWVQGDEKLVLNRHGTWLADGKEITHDATRRAFSRKIRKDSEGYFIQLGPEKKRITVEDTPYFVRRIEGSPQEGYELWLSDETHERLDPHTLDFTPGRLACRLARGEEARFLHPAYADLMGNLEEDSEGYFIRFGASGELRINLSRARP
ncbi:MAG: DUF1285 domain-containing protein [Oligoflexia bacterium]|nr:DUF1285 domain-containing protein [Oligoflexia bacterium]